MRNSTKTPQKIKNRTTVPPSNFTFGYLSEDEKTIIQKDKCTSIFIAALFIIAKMLKQLRCLLANEWRKIFHIYSGILATVYVNKE